MRIAILDLHPTEVSKATAKAVSDMIRTDMIDMNIFTVVERSQMMEILKEQGFQQTGCTDSACAVQLGKLVSAKKILIGEISKMAGGILITVRVVDVEKGTAEYAASEKAKNENESDEAARKLSLKLAERITGKRGAELLERSSGITKPEYFLRGIVPGWAQFYSGHWVHGSLVSAAFCGTAIWAVIANINYSDSKKKYNRLETGLPQGTYDASYDKYKKDGKVALASVIVVSCVYAINWIDLIFFTRPREFSKPLALVNYENIYANIGIDTDRTGLETQPYGPAGLRMNISMTVQY